MDSSSPTTCRTIPSGGSYWCNRRKRIIHVPKTHHAIACQECEYSLHLPNHMLPELESTRIKHLKESHYQQIHLGEMTIHLEFAWEDFVEKVTPVFSLSE